MADDTERFDLLPYPTRKRPPRRRLSLPMIVTAVAVALAVVAVAILVAVLATRPSSAPLVLPTPSVTPNAVEPSTPPVVETPVPEAPVVPVVQPPSRAPGPNECVDSTGDGATDLASASLTRENGDLVARFVLASDLPAGDAGVGIFAQSRNGQRAFQLGIGWVDGQLDEYFLQDLSRDDRDDLDTDALSFDNGTITARFDDDILRPLGPDFSWYAFGASDSSELDACPDAPDAVRFSR